MSDKGRLRPSNLTNDAELAPKSAPSGLLDGATSLGGLALVPLPTPLLPVPPCSDGSRSPSASAGDDAGDECEDDLDVDEVADEDEGAPPGAVLGSCPSSVEPRERNAAIPSIVDRKQRKIVRRRTKAGRLVGDVQLPDLEACFYLPEHNACKQLGIGLTVLKRVCRRFGIRRWPYRKLQRLRLVMKKAEAGFATNGDWSDMTQMVNELSTSLPPTATVVGMREGLVQLANQDSHSRMVQSEVGNAPLGTAYGANGSADHTLGTAANTETTRDNSPAKFRRSRAAQLPPRAAAWAGDLLSAASAVQKPAQAQQPNLAQLLAQQLPQARPQHDVLQPHNGGNGGAVSNSSAYDMLLELLQQQQQKQKLPDMLLGSQGHGGAVASDELRQLAASLLVGGSSGSNAPPAPLLQAGTLPVLGGSFGIPQTLPQLSAPSVATALEQLLQGQYCPPAPPAAGNSNVWLQALLQQQQAPAAAQPEAQPPLTSAYLARAFAGVNEGCLLQPQGSSPWSVSQPEQASQLAQYRALAALLGPQ